MKTRTRGGFTLFQLLLIMAFLLILFALFLPAVVKVRIAAARAAAQNNLRQIAIAAHNYHDTFAAFPPGNDANNFSAAAYLLPYLEQANLYKQIDFKKSVDDKDNADARKAVVKTFLSPLDRASSVSADYGATNYLFNAGNKPALANNNGVFYQDSKLTLPQIANLDGTSNTMMVGETLKGDGGVKAMTVKQQHVLLKKEDLKDLKDEAGVKEWKDDKNIAADRGASWMDGRFLQGTFTGTRTLNDEKPDVNCAGLGGLSGLRSEQDTTNIALCDGSVRAVNMKVKLEVWKALASHNGGETIPDF
jgi:hypothetical protein